MLINNRVESTALSDRQARILDRRCAKYSAGRRCCDSARRIDSILDAEQINPATRLKMQTSRTSRRGLCDHQGWLTVVDHENGGKSSRRWLELLGPILSFRKEVGGLLLRFIYLRAAVITKVKAQKLETLNGMVRSTCKPLTPIAMI